ncbi:unnamed protein product [Blepharisma stoltei]|uniref:Cyclic nucleotide-binding domain-containing protein n=1 Tax=Blepharisma stoltei TaxID=1481888 RepID=A0AAU9JH44_9CILI|nr:unnamed protein product [Blepharisma stoltei]
MGQKKVLKPALTARRKWSEISLLTLNKNPETPSIKLEDVGNSIFIKKRNTRRDFFQLAAWSNEGQSKYTIHPDNVLKLIWNIISIFIIASQATVIPFIQAFPVRDYALLIKVINTVNSYFILDIFLSFNTAYYAKGHVVTSRKKIMMHYLKKWFLIDILATFPFDLIVDSHDLFRSNNNNVGVTTSFKVISILKFTPLIRIVKVKLLIGHLESFLGSSAVAASIQVIKLIVFALLVAHWCACMWFFICYDDAATTPITWVGLSYQQGNDNIITLYVKALYFSITTVATVGYGDLKPYTTNEKLFCVCMLFIAVIIFSYVLSSISGEVSKQGEKEYSFREKMINLNIYMKKAYLPSSLRFKIRRYLKFIWTNQKLDKLDEDAILKMVSEPLRDDIFGITRGKYIAKCKVFAQLYSEKFIGRLSKDVVYRTFAPDDIVIQEGEKSSSVYFINSGTIELFDKATKSVFKLLEEDHYFGEIGFFAKHPRTSSARCLCFAELLILKRDDLDTILEKFPNANSITRLLQERCSKDYAILGVHCYLCKKLGHVATRCTSAILDLDHKFLKDKWLQKKGGKRLISKNQDDCSPNFDRKDRKINWKAGFDAKNVIGLYRQPSSLFADNIILKQKSMKYLDTLKQEKYRLPDSDRDKDKETTVLSKVEEEGEMSGKNKNYVNILGSSSSSEEGEEFPLRSEKVIKKKKSHFLPEKIVTEPVVVKFKFGEVDRNSDFDYGIDELERSSSFNESMYSPIMPSSISVNSSGSSSDFRNTLEGFREIL